MKDLSILILAVLLSTICIPTKAENNQQLSLMQNPIDTSVIAILHFDSNSLFMPSISKNAIPTTLTEKDILGIENLLTGCINKYNTEQYFVIDLKLYKRQYIAVINKYGEKEVWINCFCRHLTYNWKKDIVSVVDGGICYFNLKINLTKNKYYDFKVNGGE